MLSFGPRLLAALVLASTIVACSDTSHSPQEIVVGSADDVRAEVLAHIYAGALRSTGASVRVSAGIGDRGDALAELDSGETDVVPDLTGELLTTFDSTSEAVDGEDVFTDLNRSLPTGLSVTDFATAEDRQALAVTSGSTLADAKTIEDIVPRCGQSTLAVTSDDAAIVDILTERYGCTFGSVRIEADGQAVVNAIDDGSAQVASIRTASAGPEAKDLTILDDDASVLRAQNVVPLFRDGVLSDNEIRSFSVVAGELTTADLADMIGEVRSGRDSGDVAVRWLGEHDL